MLKILRYGIKICGKSIYGTTFSDIKKRDNSITIDVDGGVAKAFFGNDYAKLKEKAVEASTLYEKMHFKKVYEVLELDLTKE